MNGVNQREVRGSEHREHVMEGRAMGAILQPDAPAQRRAMTPKAENYIKSSLIIGTAA